MEDENRVGGTTALPEAVDILVVGAGFGGLAAVHRLRREHPGLSLHVIDRGPTAGGVWRDNTYPGCACDVPTALYSLSFADNPGWSHSYGRQPEIRDYLEGVAGAIGGPTTYDCALTGARWDPGRSVWVVRTDHGSVECRFLVLATGTLSTPELPDVPGLDRFRGHVFHSASWDHDRDLTGRRVAAIGTGASAIQFVPEIVDRVAHLTVFQRTPAWVIPRVDRVISASERRLYRRIPFAHKLMRALIYAYREVYVVLMALRPGLLPIAAAMGRLHLRRQVRDPGLRRRLTPTFTIGCKRMLLSNAWFPALQRPNVELVGGLRELTESGAVDDDGTEHEVDTVIFGTGFTPTEPPVARLVVGRDGRTLAARWDGSPSAYRGVSVSGFPNMFLMYGPNTNLGHSSIVLMLEAQAGYLSRMLDHLHCHGYGEADVRIAAEKRYRDEVDTRLRGTVWNIGGCSSWYIDSAGRNSVMWPTFTWRYKQMMGEFNPAAYDFDSAPDVDRPAHDRLERTG
ncbi:flavin-containing monooxygenase [Williamsia sterculiae]|uniref:Predicted flavoprotein CzcO associated with the cation diffusion facilitator CzcD n=1 Tax=Williamsia sterculiae TaxID=1344003 RepID=A0A1N7DL52_9NOCA|nr:NAD(P)/FAD-dependent oxidoreductase [Williamsia sterculiae]SIR76593.1 Predicted flavoprotein CzcO associated with the cation diffusion facilitator CzcD [Williamsia sterculiae]